MAANRCRWRKRRFCAGSRSSIATSRSAQEGLTVARKRRHIAFVARMTKKDPQQKTVRARKRRVAYSGVDSNKAGGRGDRRTLMHPIHQSEPADVARIRRVTHRARQWADWAAFFRDGMLQEIGAERQDFQSTSVYHSANL